MFETSKIDDADPAETREWLEKILLGAAQRLPGEARARRFIDTW